MVADDVELGVPVVLSSITAENFGHYGQSGGDFTEFASGEKSWRIPAIGISMVQLSCADVK